MSVFTQIVILLVVLACMVMVLLAIRQLMHYQSFDDAEETLNLREEVKDGRNVMSHNNIFHTLVDSQPEGEAEKVYSSKSKEPFSRRE